MSFGKAGLLLFVAATFVACGPGGKSPKKDSQQGEQGQFCYPNGTCNEGLVCVDNVCEVDNTNNQNNISTTNNATNNVSTTNNASTNNTSTNNTSTNNNAQVCGNGILEAGELCDGTALNGATCVSRGYGGGTLRCNRSCAQYDESGCTQPTTCGNNSLDTDEVCDGNLLAGETCVALGFDGGTLACASDCDAFDTTGCTNDLCGNNNVDGGEVCDGGDLNGATCQSRGYDGGSLACAANCGSFIETGCRECGNNTLESGEVCDGNDFGGATCQSRGYAGGQLGCNSTCSQFDESDCTNQSAVSCELKTKPNDGVCDVNDTVGCYCQGCNDNGVCVDENTGELDDCICADCQMDPSCLVQIFMTPNCTNDGVCDPFIETCACADCTDHPEC